MNQKMLSSIANQKHSVLPIKRRPFSLGLILSVCLTTVILTPISSYAMPSTKEIAIFLIQKLNHQLPYNINDEYSFTQEVTFSPDHCTLIARNYTSESEETKGKLESEIITNLANFAPDKINVVEHIAAMSENPGPGITLKTTDQKEVGIAKSYNSYSGKYLGQSKISSVQLSTRNLEEAQKVAAAFRDLITQCGGKGDLY